MRLPVILSLAVLTCANCHGWGEPHRAITRAALESIPAEARARWALDQARLIREYCLYPDDYHAATGEQRARMRVYCEKPDGRLIHNVTWHRQDDIASLEYTLSALVAALRGGNTDGASMHAGVLAHFLEDSTCPAHALTPLDGPLSLIKELLPPPADKREIALHGVIERSAPAFSLSSRPPRSMGGSIPETARNLLERVYSAVRDNRANLLDLARALYRDDEAGADRFRLQGAVAGGELLADACYTVFQLAGQTPVSSPRFGQPPATEHVSAPRKDRALRASTRIPRLARSAGRPE